MKKIFFFSLALLSFFAVADAAPVAGTQRRGTTAASTNTTAAPVTNSARAAAMPAGRTNARAAAPATATVSARSATTAPNAAPTVAARSATTAPIVNSARAASTQKVVGGGTTVQAAAKNVVVNELCQQKYEGCMDSFCMIDNASGGRCICNNRNKELNDILYEIEKLDARSYQMATEGVERLEMGDDAAAAIAKANAAANALTAGGASGINIGSTASMGSSSTSATTRRTLDLSMWNDDYWDDVSEEITGVSSKMQSIEGKTGDALHNAAAEICRAQIPECANDLNMLQMIYAQRVKADCSAYENDLKKRKTASTNKLAAAEKALRETALDQLRTANKWDLGQCTVEFKKCMQTTGGCGTDFSNCANMYAMDATSSTQTAGKSSKKNYSIKGASSTIEIAASTYDALMSKKPLCESVTKNCTNVATQVWNTFLREVAPQLKSAELIAEDKARQDCVGNISSCFQKACRDTIDPNDPEGSYDMCLTRPGTMLNVCKIPLNACGINSANEQTASQSSIWEFVLARLASMRVDSCTVQVKECLTSEDRCGSDYTQCVGLNTDTIMRMCPYDKLVGCQKVYNGQNIQGDAVYDEIARMVQGIMLNIDNNMLAMCQNAANEAMVRICGDTESCNGWAVDDGAGTRSLEYKVCQYKGEGDALEIDYTKCRSGIDQISDADIRAGLEFTSVLDGMINWEYIDIDDEGNLTTVEEYLAASKATLSDEGKQRVSSELGSLQNNIDNAIKTVESDPTLQFCMTGREVQGMNQQVLGAKGEGAGRFPELTKQMRSIIANQALKTVKDTYLVKYDELSEKMMQDFTTMSERAAELAEQDAEAARVEYGRQACLSMATLATISTNYTTSVKSLAGVSVVRLMSGGLALPFARIRVNSTPIATRSYAESELTATRESNTNQTRDKVTVTYSPAEKNCHKCTVSSKCTNWQHKTWFRSAKCKAWSQAIESCTDSKF